MNIFRTRDQNPPRVDIVCMRVGSMSMNLVFAQTEGIDVKCEPSFGFLVLITDIHGIFPIHLISFVCRWTVFYYGPLGC